MTERNPYHPDGLWPTTGSYPRTDEGAHIGPEGETDWHGLYLSENRRAEKAERERDKWHRAALTMQTERDEAYARLAEAAAEIRAQGETIAELAAENRPLAPDAITDEMVERAAHCLAMQQMPTTYSLEPDSTADKFYGDAREVLHAALTEPPARPEGAEDIEAILSELPDTMLPATDAGRADLLASRGVRVTRRDEDPSGPLRPLTTDERSYRYAQDLGYELPEDPR